MTRRRTVVRPSGFITFEAFDDGRLGPGRTVQRHEPRQWVAWTWIVVLLAACAGAGVWMMWAQRYLEAVAR